MVDGPPGSLTTSERLELLRRYEVSWETFEWSEKNTLDYPSPHAHPGNSMELFVHTEEEKTPSIFYNCRLVYVAFLCASGR